MECERLISRYFLKLSLEEQVEIYDSTYPNKMIESTFSRPIQRFLRRLSVENQNDILHDLETNTEKKGHWMWWAFPQKKKSWGECQVSSRTRYYAMSCRDAIRFLTIPSLYIYYCKAIHILKKKDLQEYFGPVDYKKFQSHVDLFHKASIWLKDDKLAHVLANILTKEHKHSKKREKNVTG